jgi:hypothetical protein
MIRKILEGFKQSWENGEIVDNWPDCGMHPPKTPLAVTS